MPDTRKMIANERFEIDEDGTFEIKIGTVTLVFEISETGPEGRRFVHLKSPANIVLALVHGADKPAVAYKVDAGGALSDDEIAKAIEIVSKAGKFDPIPHPRTTAFRHFNHLPELLVELPKATEMQKTAIEQFGSNPEFLFLVNNGALPNEMANAQKQIDASGINAGLLVKNARQIG